MGNKKDFKFPEKILNQINECSKGGFALFILGKDGLPEMHVMFDDPVHAMALQQYVINWSKAAEVVNLEGMVESLLGEAGDLGEPGEDEDDEQDGPKF